MSSENYEGDGYGHHQLDLVSNDLAVIVMSFTFYEKWCREKSIQITALTYVAQYIGVDTWSF